MSRVVPPSVKCRKGDLCAFVATVTGGIDARYTQAKFVVRESLDETKPVLLQADETDGITIDYVTGQVAVTIGATETGTLPTVPAAKPVAAQLRLYASTEDRVSFLIPFTLLPGVIGNA